MSTIMNSLHPLVASLVTLLLLPSSDAAAASKTASGPLRVHLTNPRYFTDGAKNPDGSLRAVYLGGHQLFLDLQDNSFNKEWTKDMNHPHDDAPFEQPQQESAAWQTARRNLKLTRILANRVHDFARMTPREDLASTRFCLANEGNEYIVYAPKHEAFAVSGLQIDRAYQYEWIDTTQGSVQATGSISAQGKTHQFQPRGAGAALFLAIQNDAPASDGPHQAPGQGKKTSNH